MRRFFAILSCCLSFAAPGSAIAAEVNYPWLPDITLSPVALQTYDSWMNEAQNYQQNNLWYRLTPHAPTPNAFAPNTPRPTSAEFDAGACRDYYRGLIRDGHIRIRVVYGYLETFEVQWEGKQKKPLVRVLDRKEIDLLKSHFMKPCPADLPAVSESASPRRSFACGFAETHKFSLAEWHPAAGRDSLLDQHWAIPPVRLKKKIMGPEGRLVDVFIELVASSVDPYDRNNRALTDLNTLTAEQQKQTTAASESFFEGIGDADVLVYMGHSRDGGGPSFEPGRLKPSVKSLAELQDPIDFSFFRKNRPGFESFIQRLSEAPTNPKIVAFLSCKSVPHFIIGQGGKKQNALANRLSTEMRRRDVTFIGTTGLTTSAADLPNVIGLVDSISGLKCGASFKASVSTYIPGKGKRKTSETKIIGKTP